MAKNDNPQVIRFLESMRIKGAEEAGVKFMESHPLSKAAAFDKKFEWAKNLCNFLEDNFDDDTIKEIRMGCACGPETGKGAKIKAIYDKEKDPYVFVQKANKLSQGFTLEYDGSSYYLVYPECYCSCVKRVSEPLPKAWCYCTLGYTKRMFENIFEQDIQVELVSSIKQGGTECRIKISL